MTCCMCCFTSFENTSVAIWLISECDHFQIIYTIAEFFLKTNFVHMVFYGKLYSSDLIIAWLVHCCSFSFYTYIHTCWIYSCGPCDLPVLYYKCLLQVCLLGVFNGSLVQTIVCKQSARFLLAHLTLLVKCWLKSNFPFVFCVFMCVWGIGSWNCCNEARGCALSSSASLPLSWRRTVACDWTPPAPLWTSVMAAPEPSSQ